MDGEQWVDNHLPRLEARQTIRFKGFISPEWENLTQINPSEIAISTDLSYEIILDYGSVLKETSIDGKVAQLSTLENQEFSILYAFLDEIWNQNEIIIDDVSAFAVATKIMKIDTLNIISLMNANIEQIG